MFLPSLPCSITRLTKKWITSTHPFFAATKSTDSFALFFIFRMQGKTLASIIHFIQSTCPPFDAKWRTVFPASKKTQSVKIDYHDIIRYKSISFHFENINLLLLSAGAHLGGGGGPALQKPYICALQMLQKCPPNGSKNVKFSTKIAPEWSK